MHEKVPETTFTALARRGRTEQLSILCQMQEKVPETKKFFDGVLEVRLEKFLKYMVPYTASLKLVSHQFLLPSLVIIATR